MLLANVFIVTAVASPVRADPGAVTILNAGGGTAAGGGGASETSLGQTICTAIQQPGETVTGIAYAVAGRNGTSLQVSKIFTGLAISMYCPTMMSSLPGDDWLSLLGNR